MHKLNYSVISSEIEHRIDLQIHIYLTLFFRQRSGWPRGTISWKSWRRFTCWRSIEPLKGDITRRRAEDKKHCSASFCCDICVTWADGHYLVLFLPHENTICLKQIRCGTWAFSLFVKDIGTFLQENTFRARNHVQGRYCDPFGGPGVFPGGHCRHSWSQVTNLFSRYSLSLLPPPPYYST